jgi:tetratricopeptide (TPR) repeat protein
LLLARDLRSRQFEERALFHLAQAYEGWGDWGRAADYYDEHLELSRAREEWQKEVDVLLAKAELHYKWRQAGLARKVAQEALEVARQHGDGHTLVKVWLYLGELENKLGDVKQAADYYKEAVEAAETTDDLAMQANALGSLGMAYHTMGRKWQTNRYVEKSYKLARRSENDESLMWASYRLAKVLFEQEKWAKARPFVENAEKLFAKYQLQERVEEMQRLRAELDRYQFSA